MPPRASNRQRLLIYGILVLSLWSTVTNVVPLSVCFVALFPIVPYALLQNSSVPRPIVGLLVLYSYFICSTLLYAPVSLIDPTFYRRDGNVFVTFLPAIIGGLLRIRTDIERLIAGFLKWTTAVNFVFICVFLATGGTIFFFEEGVYHFLFEAHNAAGGFLAMALAFALGLHFGGARTPWTYMMVLVNGAGLFLTVSRGSMLGLVLAVLLVLVMKERFVRLTIAGMGAVMVALLAFTYPLWLAAGQQSGIFTEESAALIGGDVEGSDANILDRMLFLWPRALDVFLKSPLVGAGYGSYNDLPYNFAGITHLVAFNRPSELVFSSAHAHNTYLHVLAETGLVGLALLIVVLRQIWKSIATMEPRSVQLGLKLGLWMTVFSSVTEHRMFTPSQMLPFTIILGLALANKRSMARSAGISTKRSMAELVPAGASPPSVGMRKPRAPDSSRS